MGNGGPRGDGEEGDGLLAFPVAIRWAVAEEISALLVKGQPHRLRLVLEAGQVQVELLILPPDTVCYRPVES